MVEAQCIAPLPQCASTPQTRFIDASFFALSYKGQ